MQSAEEIVARYQQRGNTLPKPICWTGNRSDTKSELDVVNYLNEHMPGWNTFEENQMQAAEGIVARCQQRGGALPQNFE